MTIGSCVLSASPFPGRALTPLVKRFQGETDLEGHKIAVVLFATLEANARLHDSVEEETPMHLVADVGNEKGQRFSIRIPLLGRKHARPSDELVVWNGPAAERIVAGLCERELAAFSPATVEFRPVERKRRRTGECGARPLADRLALFLDLDRANEPPRAAIVPGR